MALTFDHANLVIESTASITDLPVFHAALRDWEDSDIGVVHPVTHKWKALTLGSGGFMYQADLINGWSLKFPIPGNYIISGNLKGSIVPVTGVYVERETSTSYVTTAQGSTGPSAADIAAAVRADLAAELAMIDAAVSSRATVTGIMEYTGP
ncbi:MAG: hypothetical protein PHD04_04920 [Candidatus Pacebacteria bacterium]|nr:hypothetical protein [Candidatus Paceibacterota bacterium]